MRRILLTFVAVLMAVCSFAKEQREPSSFDLAKPVWSEAREKERNLTLTFCETVKVGRFDKASIRLTASCDYRLRVNGEFVAHGPCVAAHDFYRIDAYDLKPYLHRGKNSVTIEVAGYNCPSYYLLDQPSFLQAEVEVDGKVVAATGRDFIAYDYGERVADVPKFSFQRPYTEYYRIKSSYDGIQPEKLVEQGAKALLARGVAYPDYRIHQAKLIDGKNLYKFATNSSGFLRAKVKVEKPTMLTQIGRAHV